MRPTIALLACLLLLPTVSSAQPSAGGPVAAPPSATVPSVAPLVDKVKRSVVSVTVRERPTPEHGLPFFFGGGDEDHGGSRRGLGSGVIIDKSGLVVTNNHVIEGAETITVRLDDGRSFTGKVLGHDPQTDIALVQLKGDVKNLPEPPTLGDSDAIRVGDYVLAIGNPFGLSLTVTEGIVSAKERQIGSSAYDDFIQTDAAINPGNSGGPLFNLKGEVVGINAAIVAGGQGIGFAVPINMVKTLLPQLKKGKVIRGYMGVVIQDLTPELAKGLGIGVDKGALLATVVTGSPAARAGLQVGDAIIGMDGRPIASGSQLSREVAAMSPGKAIHLEFLRGNAKRTATLTLGTQPPRPEEQASGAQAGDAPVPARSPSKVGVALQDVTRSDAAELGLPAHDSVLIVRVDPGSPAEDAGLRPGDALLQVNKTDVTSARQAATLLRSAKPGAQVLLRVQRGEGAQFVTLDVPHTTNP